MILLGGGIYPIGLILFVSIIGLGLRRGRSKCKQKHQIITSYSIRMIHLIIYSGHLQRTRILKWLSPELCRLNLLTIRTHTLPHTISRNDGDSSGDMRRRNPTYFRKSICMRVTKSFRQLLFNFLHIKNANLHTNDTFIIR